MRFDREVRRSLSQFLNGLAVAGFSVLVLAPLANGTPRPVLAMAGAILAVLSAVAALAVSAKG